MSKEQIRKKVATANAGDVNSNSSKKKLTVNELANIVKSLASNQASYQSDTDKKFKNVHSRLETIEGALGLIRKSSEEPEEIPQIVIPKDEEEKPSKTEPPMESQEVVERKFVLSDGPHVMWKYWDYRTKCWRGPKFKIGDALAAVGHDYNLVEEVCIWVRNGEIERSMTAEEIEKYLPM